MNHNMTAASVQWMDGVEYLKAAAQRGLEKRGARAQDEPMQIPDPVLAFDTAI